MNRDRIFAYEIGALLAHRGAEALADPETGVYAPVLQVVGRQLTESAPGMVTILYGCRVLNRYDSRMVMGHTEDFREGELMPLPEGLARTLRAALASREPEPARTSALLH